VQIHSSFEKVKWKRKMLERYKGCILGLAVGDAIGAPVDFLTLDQIREKYGEKGIANYDYWDRFKPGSYTDETQLSLATAKGCLNAHLNLLSRGESFSLKVIYKRYLEWLNDLNDPFHVRHPGYTCMNVLQSGQKGSVGNPINNSTEVSGLLRTAPVGLAFPPGMAFREGTDYAAMTHGHASAYLAAGFLSEMVAQIIEVQSLQDALEMSIEQLVAFDNHQDLLKYIERALEESNNQDPIRKSIQRLGEGVTAAEVLAIGIYCALDCVSEFQEGVLASVNHSGMSTSTGMVTGAILGTLLGSEAIPEKWISELENSKEIMVIAEDMYKVFKLGERVSFEKYSIE
jgi:ADP-ribosylglycohydrolase